MNYDILGPTPPNIMLKKNLVLSRQLYMEQSQIIFIKNKTDDKT